MVDRVHHVVERRRQRVEVLAVERRDERPVQALNGVMGQRVALMLGVTNDLGSAPIGRLALEHLLELTRRPLNLLGRRSVQFEERFFAWDEAEAERHAGESLAKNM